MMKTKLNDTNKLFPDYYNIEIFYSQNENCILHTIYILVVVA